MNERLKVFLADFQDLVTKPGNLNRIKAKIQKNNTIINPLPNWINGFISLSKNGNTLEFTRISFDFCVLNEVFLKKNGFRSIQFNNCLFLAEEVAKSPTKTDGLPVQNLSFFACEFSEKIFLKGQDMEGELCFLGGQMKGGISIQQCRLGSLDISGEGYHSPAQAKFVNVDSSERMGECLIKDIEIEKELRLSISNSTENLQLRGLLADQISVKLKNGFEGSIKVADCATVKNVGISGTNKSGIIHILDSLNDGTRQIALQFSEFINESKFEVSHLKGLKGFWINNSQLGNVICQNLDLTDIKIAFNNSTSNEVILENCKLPYYRKLPRYDLVALYQGLKVAAKQQGSRLNELLFTYAEKESFRQEIRQDPKRKKDVPWTDRVVLQISHLVNEHGMDWMKPLLLLFGSCLIWYGAILLVFIDYSEPCNCAPTRMLNALQFALPTHRLENIFHPLSDGTYPPLAWAFDTLSRVTSSFFIYEMIAAFRKYSRF